jgi:hypothetical protein
MSEQLQELWDNKWLRVVAILLFVFVVLVVRDYVMVNKTADKVIEKLRKEYAPGPYAPGFDPDKVNPDLWKNKTIYESIEWKDPTDTWEEDWESQRRNQ